MSQGWRKVVHTKTNSVLPGSCLDVRYEEMYLPRVAIKLQKVHEQ